VTLFMPRANGSTIEIEATGGVVRLESNVMVSELEAELREQAERAYGSERASELSEQIAHLAEMMAKVAQRELDITDHTPTPRSIPGGGRS
jgi:hypothetical protein